MSEIHDKVANAMVERFKSGIAKAAGKPFEETGVALPNEFVWEAYAYAAVKATIEHLRANVTDGMLEAAQVSTSRLDAFDKMLEAALGELSAHPRPTEPAEQGEA